MSTPLVLAAFAAFAYTRSRGPADEAVDEVNGAPRRRLAAEVEKPIARFIPYEMDVDAHVRGLQKLPSSAAVAVPVLAAERARIGPYDPTIRPIIEMRLHDTAFESLFPLSQNNAISMDTPYALTNMNLSKGI